LLATISEAKLAILFASCLGFSLIPGPSMVYLISRTIYEGRKAGFLVATGVFTGSQMHVLIAASGMATILLAAPWLLAVIKILGGTYFVYLGMVKFFSFHRSKVKEKRTHGRAASFKESVVIETLNPKSSLFYLAFLPQFLTSDTSITFWMMFWLGTLSNIFITLGDFLIVFLSSLFCKPSFQASLNSRKDILIQGLVFLVLGITIFGSL